MKFVRPRCYFDVELSDIPLGRIVFELYSDICPITCENFRALCTGEKGIGKTTGKKLHYLNIVFHRVVKGFMIQSGDFSVGNGTGGESIYGGTFEDENFELIHDEPFLLSMANRGKDTNGSQFFITTQPAPHLDGIHVVFGHVVSGQNVVSHIENLPVDKVSRPLQDVRVVKCNELVLKSKLKGKEKRKATPASASSGEESGSEEEGEQSDSAREGKRRKKNKKEKKRKKKKKKARKHAGSDTEGEGGSGSERGGGAKGALNPITGGVTRIDPAEIPDVPAHSFLFRGGGGGRREKGGGRQEKRGGGGEREERRGGEREERQWRRENIRGYTKSGRVIKGRGVFRYRTPSRSRSRSFTPPHWKQAETRTIKLSEFQQLEQERRAKEEEMKRREEARKRRHEEREKEEEENREEKKKKRRREGGGEGEEQEQQPVEERAAEPAKPQLLRRSRAQPADKPLTPRHGREEKRAVATGPVDYNALDYDDGGTSDQDSAEEPGPNVKGKEDAAEDRAGKEAEQAARNQILVVNSRPAAGQIAAASRGVCGNGTEKGRRQASGEEKEEESSVTDDEDSGGDENDKENDKGRGSKRPPPPLDHSPSPATQRRALEALLRAKLLQQQQSSKSRSLSREKLRRRRRTLSKTEPRKRRSETSKSRDDGGEGRRQSKRDEKQAGDARSVIAGRRDHEAKDRREEKSDKSAKSEKAGRAATPDELFPDKDSVVKDGAASEMTRKSRSSAAREKKSEAIGGERKANDSASRDKFRTSRRRSGERSASHDRSQRRRRRSRDRSPERRWRDRSPRRHGGKRAARDRSSSSSERSRDRRRRRDRSSSKGKRSLSDSDRPGRNRSGGKRDSPRKEHERSEQAKRNLTARLKERARDKSRRSRRRASSSSDSSSDSASSRR